MATQTTSKLSELKSKMFKTSIDLEENVRTDMIAMLNQQLADTFDLMSMTKQAHWNVKGPEFMQLHELYDMLAEGLIPHIDSIAERVNILGGVALGTVRMAAASSRLPEFTGEPFNGKEQVVEVVKRYAQVAASTRAGIDAADEAGDMDTADLLTGVSRDLDKWLWFLEAHTQG
jgi:starvation-inducible DNA-binding protein